VAIVVFLAALTLMEGKATSFEDGLPYFVFLMLTLFACIPATLIFSDHIERNEALSPEQRDRWQTLRFRLPWAMLAYWWRYGRGVS
jgi:hypothetical protein